MTRFEIQSTPPPLKLMRVAHSRTRLPRRLGETGPLYRKFPRARILPTFRSEVGGQVPLAAKN